MLGAIAQFERELIRERMLVGIAKAKAEGKYKGNRRGADDGRGSNQARVTCACQCRVGLSANSAAMANSSQSQIQSSGSWTCCTARRTLAESICLILASLAPSAR